MIKLKCLEECSLISKSHAALKCDALSESIHNNAEAVRKVVQCNHKIVSDIDRIVGPKNHCQNEYNQAQSVKAQLRKINEFLATTRIRVQWFKVEEHQFESEL